MKLNKDRIRYLAIHGMYDKYYTSAYDIWTDALEKWMTEEGLIIVKAPAEKDGRQSNPDEQK